MIDKEPYVEVLYENQWLSLKKVVKPDVGINGYVFSHASRCEGKIVSLLPFRYFEKEGNIEIQFLIRKEITPCWGLQFEYSSITGGVENNDPVTTAIHEMAEEAGYEIKESDLLNLGECYGSKSSDSIYSLYGVNLTGKKKTLDASGDGSELEKSGTTEWKYLEDIMQYKDAQLFVSLSRLLEKII